MKTRDILYVNHLLGHKTLKHALKYIHLAQTIRESSDEWAVKVANSLEERTELLEAGFEYMTDYQDKK